MEGTVDMKRIVVGYDSSSFSQAALEWAARQAALTGAAVEVVTAWQWPMTYGWPLPVSSDYDPASDAAKVAMPGIEAARRAHPDVTIESVVAEGEPSLVLVGRSKGAALLVVGTRGHGQFTGMLLGSVSEYCVTHAHCPVVVARREED